VLLPVRLLLLLLPLLLLLLIELLPLLPRRKYVVSKPKAAI
jgi:hypothetical protein